MPKMKTKKAAAKRLKVTASGRVVHECTKLNHLLSKKTRRMKRRLGLGGEVTGRQKLKLHKLLPYSS